LDVAELRFGIELVGETHPSDLFVGEADEVQLLLDGKYLLASALFQLTRGGTLHRNNFTLNISVAMLGMC